ncbi:MAG: hypothetical protein U1E17_18075 [Geminicoccaceae bacterium]
MAEFEKNTADHIAVCWPDNHLRLTGKHETQAIRGDSSYGIADSLAPRSASRTASPGTAIAAISRIAVRARRATLPDRLADPEDPVSAVPTDARAVSAAT